MVTKPKPLQKVDARSLEARRLKALALGIETEEIQLAQTKKLAACLALEIERMECAQRNSEVIDPDLLVRVGNAWQRALDRITELTPHKPYWESEEAKAEREAQQSWLRTLTLDELLELRRTVDPDAPPPEPLPPDYVEPVLSDEQRGIYGSEEARAYAATLPQSQKKKEQETEDQGEGDDPYLTCDVPL